MRFAVGIISLCIGCWILGAYTFTAVSWDEDLDVVGMGAMFIAIGVVLL